jgi:3-dehydro-4-phosphotetronate decarboxylase
MTEATISETQAREEICRVGKSLFDRGYVHATAGNISVRLEDGFLITPTDACLGLLDPARLAKLDGSATQLSGDRASKTIALHRAIYAATASRNPAPRVVIHTHSTHCVAISLSDFAPLAERGARELVPPITPYFVMKVGHVPLMPYHRPGATETIDDVKAAIARYGSRGIPLHAVMLARLGPVVWQHTPAQAMAVLEELEETAKLWWMSRAEAAPLDAGNIHALCKAFDVKW